MLPVRFSLRTAAVTLVWRTGAAHPEGGRLRVRATAEDGTPVAVEAGAVPLAIPEESQHRLRVEASGARSIALVHPDPTVLRDVELAAPGVLLASVHLGSTAGWSRFEVWVEGARALQLAVEVVPSKLDFRADLRALVADVGRLSDDLAFALVAPAEAETQAIEGTSDGLVSGLALLDRLGEALDHAVRFALAAPLRTDVATVQLQPLHRARRVPASLLRRLDAPTPEALPARLPAHGLDAALEGPEHRLLAATLRARADEARRLAAAQPATMRGRAGRARMQRLAARLDALLRLPALAAVPVRAAPPAALPLRGTLAPGYREAFVLLERVRQRLAVAPGRLPAPLRSLHLLYETWAFLAVAEACAAATGARLDPRRLLRPTGAGARLRLGPLRLGFRAAGGVRLVLERAPLVDAPLMPHALRPDMRLVRTVGEGLPTWTVLDAKYRLDRTPGYLSRIGAPGPPPGALGALHRYRDALVDAHGVRRTTLAAALYPWRDDGRWADSVLAHSLDALGVGAVPALPGSTDALTALVEDVVAGRWS